MKHSEGFLRVVEAAKKRIREITVEQFEARRSGGESFVLVDVREDSEWAQGRARGAVHLGKGVIERDVEALYPDKAAPLVLYCGGGFRSALSADSLQAMGYTNVLSLAGGWRAWMEKGLPVES